MLAHARFAFYCLVTCFAIHVFSPVSLVADTPVKFDVPAIVSATPDVVSPPKLTNETEKTIQVVIPVSSEIDLVAEEQIEAFRFDVFWNRNGFQVTDYSPRSETFSEINGDLLIETSQEDNAGGGLHLQSGFKSAFSGNASVDIGSRESTRRKYSQRAKQEILIASGTSHRGTGAFFRFHRSSQQPLEGGRQLTVKFQVPKAWRAGVLRVDCYAKGTREVFRGWTEPYEYSRTFVVPVFLANDTEAKAAATEFSLAEQRLRLSWRDFQTTKTKPSLLTLPSVFATVPTTSDRTLPEHWVHYLIQSGNDAYLDKYHARLPKTVASNAEKFVIARRSLMRMQ